MLTSASPSRIILAALVQLSSSLASGLETRAPILDVQFAGSTFTVTVDGKPWFPSAAPFLQADSAVASLRLQGSYSEKGSDPVLGDFVSFVQDWEVDGHSLIIHSIRKYLSLDVVEFLTRFPDGVNGTSVGDSDAVCAAFTAFRIEGPAAKSSDARGYASWAGNMLADKYTHFGVWNEDADGIQGGKNGSLLAVFDKEARTTVVLSASSQFMSANFFHTHSSAGNFLQLGLLGSVTSIPVNFEMSFMLSASQGGPNAAFSAWGNTLLAKYGKGPSTRKSDYTLNYLGYSTDNGAYYYYHVENATSHWTRPSDFEQTQLDLKAYADRSDIPYRYILLDSWWYLKDESSAVTMWEADPAVYPHGLYNMWQQTGWPVQGHNRFWSAKTPYAKQNGGNYEFIVEPHNQKSIPVDQRFWDDLLANATKWGLINYEQDWLHNEFEGLQCTLESATLARQWLLQMGNAAAKNGITIQYCMPYPRHVLQSVEVPAVTNFRASDDYRPGGSQWKLGLSSLIAYALGLAPSKDNYWSTRTQPGNNWHAEEPYSELNSVVSSFTAGPVAPSDMIGHSDADLIRRACNSDGLLLKPSRPATSIDATFAFRAFGYGGPDGEVTATYSDLGELRYHHVLAADMKSAYKLTPAALPGHGTSSHVVSFEHRPDRKPTLPLKEFDEEHPILIPACGQSDFHIFLTAPVLANGWVILGELSKWVPTSPERIQNIAVTDEGLSMALHGGSGEEVEMVFVDRSGLLVTAVCKLPAAGMAILRLPAATCQEADPLIEHVFI